MACKVEIKEWYLEDETRFGKSRKRVGLDRVYVNGRLGGYTPNDTENADDPNIGVFHPISGFPPAMEKEVVAACKSLHGSLPSPIPHVPMDAEELDGDDE